MQRRHLTLAIALLCLTGWSAGINPAGDAAWISSAYAEKGQDGKDGEPTEDDTPDAGPDLGDKNVPFAERVNKAIEEGTHWLLARPKLADMPGADDPKVAHWGFIKGKTFYGGKKGKPYRHPAGPTALALYTLLKCGVSPKHPVIERGFNFLQNKHKITTEFDDVNGKGYSWRLTEAASSYELSVMILALTAKYDHFKKSARSRRAKKAGKLRIKDPEDKEWLQEMVRALESRRGLPNADDKSQLWRYNVPQIKRGGGGRKGGTIHTLQKGGPGVHGNTDLSSTQLAALALFSAQRFGVHTDPDTWFRIIEYTLGNQEEEGPKHERHDPIYQDGRYAKPIDHARGFCYLKGSPSHSEGKATGAMTACGIANLLMAKQILANHKSKKARKRFMDGPLPKKMETAVWDGLAWLDRHWSSFANPVKNGYHVYYLYCLERAMDILGKRLVGKHMWYVEGAKQLLRRQKPVNVKFLDGKRGKTREAPGVFWNTKTTHEPYDVLDTCFALLFLKRATRGLVPIGPVTGG